MRGYHNRTYRSWRYPAFLLSQYNQYRWYLGLDPEAPVEHEELVYCLELAERQKLFGYAFVSPSQAKRALCGAVECQGRLHHLMISDQPSAPEGQPENP